MGKLRADAVQYSGAKQHDVLVEDVYRFKPHTGTSLIHWLLCVLSLVLLLSGCGVSTTSPSPFAQPDSDGPGMVIRDPWYDFGTDPDNPAQPNRAAQDRMGAMLAELGVQWVRLEFHIEGSDLTVEEQIARNDYFIREVAPRHNLKVLGLLGFGLIRGQDPRILGQPTSETDPIYGSGIDNARRIWLDRARLIAARYQGDVAAYQILNEPNRVSPVWNETLPAAEVAHLHTTFYRFFHHIDRERDDADDQTWRDDVQIISGAIQPAGSGVITEFGHLPDTYYLRQLYASAAFTDYHDEYGYFPLDGLGYHPYPQEVVRSLPPTPTSTADSAAASEADADSGPDPQRDLELLLSRLDEARAVLEEMGDPQQPFWITEIGHNAGFENQTAATQAEFLRLAYTALNARDDVATIFWFKYEDFPPASGPGAQKWGSVVIPFSEQATCPGGACYDVQGRPVLLRPSFWAYREIAGRGDALPEPPAQVTVRGPLHATVDADLTFTARISRTTATRPVSYTWQLAGQDTIQHQDGAADSVVLRWTEPGTYPMLVEAANPAGVVISQRVLRVYPENTTGLRGLRKR